MELVAKIETKLDEGGKLAWIAAMVLGFVVYWPIGLVILIYMMWSGRMGCSKNHGPGRWHRAHKAAGSAWWHQGNAWWHQGWHQESRTASSGNHAFDEYREETLRHLEEEQGEFLEFLERLRHAKDKAEFDQFMADRKSPPGAPETDTTEGPVPA